MHEIHENKNEMTADDGPSTLPKNPDPNSPLNDEPASEFPPDGFMSGHIFIRPRNNATRFKIRASNGMFYDYEGTPKEGDHLRRLAPVVFRCSPHSLRTEELTEITNAQDASSVIPLEGILITHNKERSYGEIAVARRDGSHDDSPFKFFLSNLEDPNSKIPKVGSHVLFKTDFARSNRLNKQGQHVGNQRYINIVHITHDTSALRTRDTNVANPALLKLLRSQLKITLEVGTEPVHSTFTSLTALQALNLEQEDLPYIIEHMHEATRTHCHRHKHIKIPDTTSSSSSTDPPNPLTTQEQALLTEARDLRHTLDKEQPINILIKPQAWLQYDTADKWVRHINFTLSTDLSFAKKVGKIYLLEHADIDTTTNTIIPSNPQIISRPTHSHLPNHVHRIHYIDTPTHEGEWNGSEVEYARARKYSKYIIHEFRSIAAEYVPAIKTISLHDMEEATADDASQATVGPAPITQITVHHPTHDHTRSTAAQQTLEQYDDFPMQKVELFSPIPNWKKYAIDAPMTEHNRILTHLNSHKAGIVAMSEAEFQNAGMNDTSTHITLITRKHQAGSTASLAITHLLATDNKDGQAPTPARAYATSPHTLTISSHISADDVETRLSLYKKAIGEKEFPFLAFYINHALKSEDDAELRWTVPEPEKRAPTRASHEATFASPMSTVKEHCVLEINGAPTLVTPANTTKLEAIFAYYDINKEAAQLATWVRDNSGHYAIKVWTSLQELISKGPMKDLHLAVSPRGYKREEYPIHAYKVIRRANNPAANNQRKNKNYTPTSEEQELFTVVEQVRTLHLG
jgi:hypothetical protein